MTEAVRACVDHAFTTWKLNRVMIQAAVENTRSRAIPERLGFREEGILREVERIGDRMLDDVVYAMLAADWPGAPVKTVEPLWGPEPTILQSPFRKRSVRGRARGRTSVFPPQEGVGPTFGAVADTSPLVSAPWRAEPRAPLATGSFPR